MASQVFTLVRDELRECRLCGRKRFCGLRTVGENDNAFIADFQDPVTDNQQLLLAVRLEGENSRNDLGEHAGMTREHAETSFYASGGDGVDFILVDETFGSDNAEFVAGHDGAP